MKKHISTLFLLVSLISTPGILNAQSICLVSADFETGENYIVFWEPLPNLTNLDSVLIYRKQGTEVNFTKIGAVDITPTSPTMFVDENVNTIGFTQYAISLLNINGGETALSSWHQPILLDWDPSGAGKLFWTKYKTEDMSNIVDRYEVLYDQTTLGYYQMLTTVYWSDSLVYDQAHALHVDATYYVQAVMLNACNIQTKANINTSRSNIKQQFSNAEAGVSPIAANKIDFEMTPNPSSDFITVQFNQETVAKMTISDLNGKTIKSAIVTGKSYTLAIDDLTIGNYFVNIEQNGVVSSKKFIKN